MCEEQIGPLRFVNVLADSACGAGSSGKDVFQEVGRSADLENQTINFFC
jgi:hypothetical protein